MIRTKTNDYFFYEIDNELKAYLLGFFVADGYIGLNARCKNSYRLGITLKETDEYIIKLYHDNICPYRTITYQHNNRDNINRLPTYSITWTSNIMMEYLKTKYNIITRKTYDLDFVFPFELIKGELVWDFIRGFFDGDGQFSYNDNNHTSTFAMYGTSYNFLKQIGDIFESNFNVSMRIEGTKKKDITLYCLRFDSNYHKKEFLLSLYEKFYYRKKYFLERKRKNMYKYLCHKYRANLNVLNNISNSVEHSESHETSTPDHG